MNILGREPGVVGMEFDRGQVRNAIGTEAVSTFLQPSGSNGKSNNETVKKEQKVEVRTDDIKITKSIF